MAHSLSPRKLMALLSFGGALLVGLVGLSSSSSLAFPAVGNGKRIADTVIPEVVQIEWRKKTHAGFNGQVTSYAVTSSFCTGTFVSSTTLITAADCVLKLILKIGDGDLARSEDDPPRVVEEGVVKRGVKVDETLEPVAALGGAPRAAGEALEVIANHGVSVI